MIMRLPIRELRFQVDGDVIEECLAAALSDYWFDTQLNHPRRQILWNGKRQFGYMSYGYQWVIFGFVPDSIVDNAAERLSRSGYGGIPISRLVTLAYIAELKQEAFVVLDQCAA